MKIDRSQVLLFLLLVLGGAAVRLGLRELPNFAPVAAIALFAGYAFRSRWLAVAVPLSIMAVSDLFIGGYDWGMMIVVYAALAAPVFARDFLRRYFALDEKGLRGAIGSVVALIASALGSSVFFFLVTNFGAYLQWYERTWQGLFECYLLAAPFFRYTLAGDLVFATVLFTAYAFVAYARTSGASLQPAEK